MMDSKINFWGSILTPKKGTHYETPWFFLFIFYTKSILFYHIKIWSDLIRPDQIWSDLIRSDQIWSDQIWSDLIRSDQIWSDLVRFASIFLMFLRRYFWCFASIFLMFLGWFCRYKNQPQKTKSGTKTEENKKKPWGVRPRWLTFQYWVDCRGVRPLMLGGSARGVMVWDQAVSKVYGFIWFWSHGPPKPFEFIRFWSAGASRLYEILMFWGPGSSKNALYLHFYSAFCLQEEKTCIFTWFWDHERATRDPKRNTKQHITCIFTRFLHLGWRGERVKGSRGERVLGGRVLGLWGILKRGE